MTTEFLPLPTDPRWRRVVLIALFLGFLAAFRHLAPVFVCAVLLARGLGTGAELLRERSKLGHRGSVLITLGVALAIVIAALGEGMHRAWPFLRSLRHDGRGHVERFMEQPIFEELRHFLGHDGGDVHETIKHYAMESVHYATAFAHLALFLFIGFLLSVIYLLEQHEIDAWMEKLPALSLIGTFVRWGHYAADAIVITVRIQAVTALVNAVVTLPVILFLHLPHAALLFFLVLMSGLVPVVGNFIAGAVLSLVAFQARGVWAVGIFLLVTFFLHKIESYYLTPRLAAQHVRLPGFVLVVSLLLFEQAFGFVGLFLSFPTLYVAMRIRNEWAEPNIEAP